MGCAADATPVRGQGCPQAAGSTGLEWASVVRDSISVESGLGTMKAVGPDWWL